MDTQKAADAWFRAKLFKEIMRGDWTFAADWRGSIQDCLQAAYEHDRKFRLALEEAFELTSVATPKRHLFFDKANEYATKEFENPNNSGPLASMIYDFYDRYGELIK